MAFKLIWLWQLETWMTQRLLRSPTFHHLVRRVHQRVEHIRHGTPPEPSRTSLDHNGNTLTKFIEYFKEEIKDQIKGNPRKKL